LGLGFVDARGEEALLFHWRSHLFGESPSEREREREKDRSARSILCTHTEFPESVMRETFRGKLKFHQETFIFVDERERERERESFHAFASECCKQAKLFAQSPNSP
jgi:hypothetical protein